MASTNFAGVECTSSGLMNTSVEPHQQVTSRETRLVLRKFSISSLICSARSYLLLPFFMYVPSNRLTYSRSKAAFIGEIPERNGASFSHQLNASHKRRADCAHSRQQHAQFTLRRRNLDRLIHSTPS